LKNIKGKMPEEKTIFVCQGTGCVSNKSVPVYNALKEEIEKRGIKNVKVDFTGCHGFCEKGPLVVIEPDGVLYTHVKPHLAGEIVEKHIVKGELVKNLLYIDPVKKEEIPLYKEIGFYKGQLRLILRNCGKINPESIDDALKAGAYTALRKALFEMKPEEVIEEIKKSGLRGRGGAGFPTGLKWEATRKAKGKEKYIICNGDEGDPGAFMDRSLLEADPHSVIEGMIIAAYAIGAKQGFVYVRAEYPLAVKRLRKAIEDARERGFLGKSILGKRGFDFDIEIMEGAGAFVCGEETALIASLEGKRGMPRQRPPYPAEKGYNGKPTNINNVKTYASVPVIINRGADYFASIGTETSKGTMVFALTGKINNSGLIEVPMGITLRQIVYEIGGGIPKGKKFKAAQTGGPSGGCVPEAFLDVPIDYESLTSAGSMMGSGGIIIADEDTCMVDFAKYFLDFTQKESCGKCVPCRVGTRHMFEILKRITEGKGKEGDIELLEELAKTVKETSLCGLGQTAPNPVLTTIRYFKDEYIAHIERKECPARVCKELISFYILPEKCVGCLLCLKNCPAGAITGELKKVHVINQEKCVKCGVCYEVCPPKVSAVVKLTGEERRKAGA
jgi:NADH:ubiquinone oxidoreductase subunit F (NADH-binding)/(2Fe-2S) ferredoxin/Pyruvate/2-oxoacid:ferredoxin oxidoreductase delta subunit